MQKCAGAIITWLIHQQAIQERDRELSSIVIQDSIPAILDKCKS